MLKNIQADYPTQPHFKSNVAELHTNIRLACEKLLMPNTLAYFNMTSVTKEKGWLKLTPI